MKTKKQIEKAEKEAFVDVLLDAMVDRQDAEHDVKVFILLGEGCMLKRQLPQAA